MLNNREFPMSSVCLSVRGCVCVCVGVCRRMGGFVCVRVFITVPKPIRLPSVF